MSNFTIIHEIARELRARIFEALRTAPGVDFHLTDVDNNILIEPFTDKSGPAVKAFLYLYHLDINKSLRNQRMLPQPGQADEFRTPPLPLQLRFLFTPVEDGEGTQLLILGRVLQYFHDYPELSSLAGEPLDDSFGGASAELRVRPEMLSVEQLTQIWSAFNQPYRLTAAFLVEVVAVDSAKAPARIPRVVDASAAVGMRSSDSR